MEYSHPRLVLFSKNQVFRNRFTFILKLGCRGPKNQKDVFQPTTKKMPPENCFGNASAPLTLKIDVADTKNETDKNRISLRAAHSEKTRGAY